MVVSKQRRYACYYTIAFKGDKLLDNFRGDRVYGQLYYVIKVDRVLLTEIGFYEVTTGTLGEWCNCKGAERVPRCRHLQMLDVFKEKKAIGKGKLYDYEAGQWVRRAK